MSKYTLRRDINKDRSFVHVVNFLTGFQVMTLADARLLFKAFHVAGEDVIIDMPDGLDAKFSDAMSAVKIEYEKI